MVSKNKPSTPYCSIKIKGMMCERNCGSTVRKSLENISSVNKVNVSLANKVAEVWIHSPSSSSSPPSEIELRQAIQNVGFEVISVTIDREQISNQPSYYIGVNGMMCDQNCGATVRKAIENIPGVTKANVSSLNKLAEVWTQNSDSASTVTPDILRDAIKSVGFDVTTISSIKNDITKDSIMDIPIAHVTSDPADVTYHVKGMFNKKSCPSQIHDAVSRISGVTFVVVDYDSKQLRIWGFADHKTLAEKLEKLGYSISITLLSSLVTDLSTVKSPFYSTGASSFSDSPRFSVPSDDDLDYLEMKISNMSCANCVGKVEKTLKGTCGIHSIKIALLSEKAEIIHDARVISTQQIIQIIEKLGYNARIKVTRKLQEHTKKEFLFKVTGLSCSNCVQKVERTLMSLPEIDSATVSLLTNKLLVKFKPENSLISLSRDEITCSGPRDVIDQITRLGYTCKLINTKGMGEISLTSDSETDQSSVQEFTEQQGWCRLLVVAALFGVPVMFLHLLGHDIMPLQMMLMKPSLICPASLTVGQTVMMFLNTPIQLIVGFKFYRVAFISALNLSFGMDFLIVLGTTITFSYSMFSVIFACTHDSVIKHLFFEASGMLFLFVTLGKYLESYAKGQTVSAISTLLQMQPQEALLVLTPTPNLFQFSTVPTTPRTALEACSKNEMLRHIEIDLVQKGDILKVLPGARVPTDGVIIFGSTSIDESMITGESLPVIKKIGDSVYGSTVNQNSVIYVRVTAISNENALSQIISLVESAQMNKAPIQAYADRIATIFVPIVVSMALITFIGWYTACSLHVVPVSWYQEEFGDPFLFSMLFGISVVVISCPCALGLATPTAIMVGTSIGATNGVLIKGGPAFETAHKIKAIIFDKTGTLTIGRPTVTNVAVIVNDVKRSNSKAFIFDLTDNSFSNSNNSRTIDSILSYSNDIDPSIANEQINTIINRIINLAANAEQSSEHPLARAILTSAEERKLLLSTPSECSFTMVQGMGILLETSEGLIAVGNRAFMISKSISLNKDIDDCMWILESEGKTVVCVALKAAVVGLLAISDSIKPEAVQTVAFLRSMGIDVWMVTGDNRTTAEAIADELDIPENRVLAGVLPAEKANKVQELQCGGKVYVAMVGDGINDSVALAQADLGIAIGAGTQVAIEAADMVLIRNDITDVVVALDLAKNVFNRVRLNFIFSFMYNMIAIPFAAGVWYPWTRTLVSPQYAGLFMALSSISVVLSSLSLRLYTRPATLTTSQNQSITASTADLTSKQGQGMNISDTLTAIASRQDSVGIKVLAQGERISSHLQNVTAAVNGLSSVIGADSDGLKRRRGSREAPGEHFGHKHDYSQLVNETDEEKLEV